MRWAGIGWQGTDFEVVVLDAAGREVVPPASFGAGRIGELTALLRRNGVDLAAVVESTNGVLDGHLLAAGLPLYRPDPATLSGRPEFGSVSARDLAETARADPAALYEITIASGGLVGRTNIHSGLLVTRGSGREPEIAITFDDGPDPVHTPQVLDILDRYGVTASFFCVGLNVDAHPHLVDAVASRGHYVGNHTWSHPYLPDLARDEVLRQVDSTGEALARVLGQAPALARPPYGQLTPDVLTWLTDHGLTTVVWDVDAGDWAEPGVDTVVANTVEAATAGSVILMHDAGGDRSQTVAALPKVLETLLDRGYRFVAIDKLTC